MGDDNFNLILFLNEEVERKQLLRNILLRCNNPFDTSDRLFMRLYRLNKQLVHELIEDLREHLAVVVRSSCLTPEHRVSFNFIYFKQFWINRRFFRYLLSFGFMLNAVISKRSGKKLTCLCVRSLCVIALTL